jgi:hypothetical protein
MIRSATVALSVVSTAVWVAFAGGILLWGVLGEASYELATSAPQQAAAAAYTASGAVVAYAFTRAITGAIRVIVEELRAGERQ